jgi:transposase
VAIEKPLVTRRTEAPMKRVHWIGLDVHCRFCEVAVLDPADRVVARHRCLTRIPDLAEVIEAVPQPRRVVLEEGPLADWLVRNLRGRAEEVIACDPRRNRLIAAEGDKDDPLDAERLARLGRGGYVKAVHHAESLTRAVFKQHVALYHDRVRHRVGEAHRANSLVRRHGVMARERDMLGREDRDALLSRLPASPVLRADVELLWRGYDAAAEQEQQARRQLVRLAREDETARRFEALPGVGWVRAATLLAFLDTPWRFASKQALWRYLGIGLERRRSGNGPERLRVPLRLNRLLKVSILGAARSAVIQGDNPFADQHRRWISQGLSPRLARRNVARSLAAVLWGMWKSGNAYRPEWVGRAAVTA